MGPPREHGGMRETRTVHAGIGLASMGPPREHGGMLMQAARKRRNVGRSFNGAAA